ncbi:MAG: OmpA family protein [Bacteroidales bacterium]|nr:OmpA family protein [Bacteroidales bacterium]MBN2817688.1 OmpA family protein [Bacteroidales bacterium]
MRALVIIILIAISSTFLFAQNKTSINDVHNVYDEKGDYYFDRKNYKKAIVYYNMAYKSDAKNYYSVLRKAEAFTELALYDQAAESYKIIFETNLYIPNEFRLQYALLLLSNKDIKGFEKWMGNYNKIVQEEISGYLSSSEVRAKMYKDSSLVIVENESVLNTAESEISPYVIGDKLIFASTRKDLMANTVNNYYNLFSASYLTDGKLGKLNMFNSDLNTTLSESALSYSGSTKKLYLTRSSGLSSALKSYEARVFADVKAKLDLTPVSVGGITNIGQVSFNNNDTKMYFVSDAPGGSGGLDIYFSELVNGVWSKPQNMGSAVNTAKDEMFPYVLNDTVLFFSSNGLNGLGGFDLYSLNLKNPNSTPKNLGSRVNSNYDDYALSFSAGGLTGYFCSNRPGGFGKEDIYRVHLLDIKVKYAAYRFKRKSFMEDDKINLYLSDGEEYNIAAEEISGFNFGFQPEEGYKMIIQHENPLATDIIYNTNLSESELKTAFLYPKPIEKTEIPMETGMRYQFTAGMKPISSDFKKALEDMSKLYQASGSSAIDFTALAKELQLREGEVYTIRFVKDDSQISETKSKEVTSLFINDKTIPVNERSFFIVLPLDIQASFNIKTDIDHFKENFSPKKTGGVKVDATPVLKEEPVKEFEGFPILVNTEKPEEVSKNKIKAKELSIVPGTMYLLTLKKKIEGADDLELFIPLTKGVKYNLGTDNQDQAAYNIALSQMAKASSTTPGEELIDISVLSKELDIVSDQNVVFSLTPAPQIGSQATTARSVLTTLNVDGRKYYVASMQKIMVNLKLEQNQTVNIQTDLGYVKENFESSTIALSVDTSSFNNNIKEIEKDIITDPVFDVIVVNFDLNDYSIRPDAKSILADKVVQVLKGDTRLYVTIKGYTDPLGNAAYNEKLSMNRARAVKEFLSNNGIGESRIRTFSFGDTMALKQGQSWESLSEEELKKHRKVEIVIYLPK